MLVDNHPVILESWKFLLENDPRFSIVAECDNGNDAIHKAGISDPDIILMDINMSPVNGFDATEKIVSDNPHIKIIGISINNQPGYANHLIKLGAKGFVSKGSSFEELTMAIVQVYNGSEYICEDVRRFMN